MFQFESKGKNTPMSQLKAVSRSSLLLSLSVLVRPSTDWTRPTHVTEDNLLYSRHQFEVCGNSLHHRLYFSVNLKVLRRIKSAFRNFSYDKHLK